MDMLETVGSGNQVLPGAFTVFVVYRDKAQSNSEKSLFLVTAL